MLIEYRIKYEDGGVTITQSVEPYGSISQRPRSSTTQNTETPLSGKPGEKELGSSFAESKAAAQSRGKRREGGGGESDKPGPGGGGEPDKPGTGGGGPMSGMVIVFGPVVIGPSEVSKRNRTGAGGEPDKPGPGGGETDKPGPNG
jgi:hypothetical protein